ncbi:MAG TPA: hypothetical protein V6C63_04550 [Allocoleopsis sp.]
MAEPEQAQPQTPPAQSEVQTPPNQVTEFPDQGRPATEHLSSEGKFATVNPAGTAFTPTGEQIDVGDELPPSVQRIRQTGDGFVDSEQTPEANQP